MNDIDSFFKKAGWVRKHAVAGENSIHQQSGGLDPVLLQVCGCCAHIVGKFPTHIGSSTKGIWCRYQPHIGAQLDVLTQRGRHRGNGVGATVISQVGDNKAVAAGIQLGDAVSQIIRFATGAGKHGIAQAEFGWKPG